MPTPRSMQHDLPLNPELDSTSSAPQEIPTRDLRSNSVPIHRAASEGYKYNYFKSVKRGDLGQKFMVSPNIDNRPFHSVHPYSWWPYLTANPLERKAHTWTKRELYIQAQGYPCPPRRHHAYRDTWDSERKTKPKDELVVAMQDDPSMGRWDEQWEADEWAWYQWYQSLLYPDDVDGGDEWYWGQADERHKYWGPAMDVDRTTGVSEAGLQARRNKMAGALVDRALQRWEERRRREEDRIIAQTWEILSDGGDLSDDGWADD
ncbi:hypothetical protein MMC18_006994 [Xylographa bjoerkii]|nr:hypothetical protein [Xylographa bjoerkii]